RSALPPSVSATTASSPATSRAPALCPVPPRPSSATTARASATSRLTAPPCV
ncbi:unnamed protein product, partial [Penicillium nalgiovense]